MWSRACETLLGRLPLLQEEGGMRTADGKRRRTPGGVFYTLIKDRMPRPDYNRVRRRLWRASHVAAGSITCTTRALRSMSQA
ncbi:MAG: hypothetical protein EOO65_06035 [Methanosarcinales archaeon]|nr:MAG: hypothetical protein EOO65_06035 [Methanosarcinales archaeon]